MADNKDLDIKAEVEKLRLFLIDNYGCITSVQSTNGDLKRFYSSMTPHNLKLKLPEGWELLIKNKNYFIANKSLKVQLPLKFPGPRKFMF